MWSYSNYYYYYCNYRIRFFTENNFNEMENIKRKTNCCDTRTTHSLTFKKIALQHSATNQRLGTTGEHKLYLFVYGSYSKVIVS